MEEDGIAGFGTGRDQVKDMAAYQMKQKKDVGTKEPAVGKEPEWDEFPHFFFIHRRDRELKIRVQQSNERFGKATET